MAITEPPLSCYRDERKKHNKYNISFFLFLIASRGKVPKTYLGGGRGVTDLGVKHLFSANDFLG